MAMLFWQCVVLQTVAAATTDPPGLGKVGLLDGEMGVEVQLFAIFFFGGKRHPTFLSVPENPAISVEKL